MERLNRSLVGSSLGLIVAMAVVGCKTPESTVPPGTTYAPGSQPAVGFTSAPNPPTGVGFAGANSGTMPQSPYGGAMAGSGGSEATSVPSIASSYGGPPPGLSAYRDATAGSGSYPDTAGYSGQGGAPTPGAMADPSATPTAGASAFPGMESPSPAGFPSAGGSVDPMGASASGMVPEMP